MKKGPEKAGEKKTCASLTREIAGENLFGVSEPTKDY
jgi:hypothetical protein